MELPQELQKAIAEISKQHGKGVIISDPIVVDMIPTKSIQLNVAIGNSTKSGVPRGGITEIYGQESSGKTGIALGIIAEAQRLNPNGFCVYVDMEHALSEEYCKKLGIDMARLIITQPDYGEQAIEIADKFLKTHKVDVIVIDSVSSLVPKAELDGDIGDAKMGLMARLMSQSLRKIMPEVKKSNTACIFINQMREKIGVVYGNPWTTTGGNALKFYAMLRIEVSKSSTVDKDAHGDISGLVLNAKVVKNKIGRISQKCELKVSYENGIDSYSEIIDLGVKFGVIRQAGSWLYYEDAKFQGKESLKKELESNISLKKSIEDELDKKLITNASSSKAE